MNYWYILLLSFLVFFQSCEEILFENDLTAEQIVRIAPIEGAVLTDTTVEFRWQALEGAESYIFQIATPDFASANSVVMDTLLVTTDFTQVLPAARYQWRIQGRNSNYSTAYTTGTFALQETSNFQERELSLIAPVNDSNSNIPLQQLSWNEVTDATLYTIEIWDSSNTLLTTNTTADTEIAMEFPEGSSTWQVRGEKGTEKTAFSSALLTIDTQVPSTPILTLPEDASSTLLKDISFQWTRELVEGTTEFDSLYIYRDANFEQLEHKSRASSPAVITLETNTYFWQVIGFDLAGNQSNASAVRTITIN